MHQTKWNKTWKKHHWMNTNRMGENYHEWKLYHVCSACFFYLLLLLNSHTSWLFYHFFQSLYLSSNFQSKKPWLTLLSVHRWVTHLIWTDLFCNTHMTMDQILYAFPSSFYVSVFYFFCVSVPFFFLRFCFSSSFCVSVFFFFQCFCFHRLFMFLC